MKNLDEVGILFKDKQMLLKEYLLTEQKRVIKKRMFDVNNIEFLIKHKESWLAFKSVDIICWWYKNLNAALTRIAKKQVCYEGEKIELIKCSSGAGSYAKFVFSENVIRLLIKAIKEENRKELISHIIKNEKSF